MPTTKQKIIRHQVLDRCFRNQSKRYYINDLLEECNKVLRQHDCQPISLRTLRNDLNEFEDVHNTIIEHINDGSGQVYYRYADPKFSIQKTPLTDEELAKLKETVLMLNRFKGLPQFEWMTELLAKMEVKMHLDEYVDNVISFESNQFVNGIEYLDTLFNFIVNHQAIEICYKPFNKPAVQWVLHPYHIKQYNNRWFLFAQNEAQQIVTVALDRIKEIAPSNKPYIPSDIDFSEYFDDVIGVSILNVPTEHILLKFNSARLPYVISKPLHHSQKIKDKDNGIIEIQVKPNRELISQLLSFGEDVEILQPENLRNEIKGKIRKMQVIYN